MTPSVTMGTSQQLEQLNMLSSVFPHLFHIEDIQVLEFI